MTRAKVSEPKVKAGISAWLKSIGAWFFMPVQTGMGVGGIHDFIACVPVVITPEMVGKRLGLFVSVEAKESGLVANLRALHERGRTMHAHIAKDGVFISNRPLQSWQADGIHDASGKAFIADDAEQLNADFNVWLYGLSR
jgi:ribosomal protein S19